MTVHRIARLLLALLLAASAAGQDPFNDPPPGQPGPGGDRLSEAEVVVDTRTIAPGIPFTVALKVTHPPKWHSYFHNDGIGISQVPTFTWDLPEGFSGGEIQWPTPRRAEFVGLTTYGYFDTVYFTATITPPAELPVGQPVTIGLDAAWQTCKEACVNESLSTTLTLPVAAEPVPNEEVRETLAVYRKTQMPGPTPDDWTVEARTSQTTVTLRLTTGAPLPKDLFFFDYNAQVDPQAAQEWTSPEDGVWELVAPRNKGNAISDTPGPMLAGLRGILAAPAALPGAERNAVWIEEKFPAEDVAVDTPAPRDPGAAEQSPVREDTPEEIAAMAELYDPEKPINYVLLKEAALTTLWTALLGAFIGGMILNLMPCVFPVLGIKVLGFVEQAGSQPAKVRLHGLAFTGGLVASMWVLAGVILILKFSLGQEVNWGQQMGNPYFVGGIIILLFLLGLNLAGVFEIGTSLTGAGGGLQQKKGYSGSFFSGVLTTLIATPCSGPFLGAAMSYTLAQPAGTAMFLFTIFALGIASPYLFLSFFPALINKLPRPGAWMETFKKTMSFALFGTAAFFLKTFGTQTGADGVAWLAMGLAVLALAAFIYGHWSQPRMSPAKRIWAGKLLPVGVAALGFWIYADAAGRTAPLTRGSDSHLAWEPWRPGKVEQLRKKGRIVWVDYTADW